MKKLILSLAVMMTATNIFAQEEPLFLPGEGIYYVGLPSTLSQAVSEPTLVTQAYQAKLTIKNAELASSKVNGKSYNITKYISEDGNTLDLVSFMGVGETHGMVVRNTEGGSYELGKYAPNKTWSTTHLIAAYPKWENKASLPLCMYDQWDCPVSYDADPFITEQGYNSVKVEFSNAHEGLVAKSINFPLVIADDCDKTKSLDVTLTVWDAEHNTVLDTYKKSVKLSSLTKVMAEGFDNVYSLSVKPSSKSIIINTAFDITVDGFAQDGVKAWIPRSIDTHNLYPSFTTYSKEGSTEKNAASNACINLDGYYNYIGTWGWWDGKTERGEVVPQGDYVQVYYDPSDPDWPGDFYMGEATFPVECTFGVSDITVYDAPSWIPDIACDEGQWEEYGAIQLIMHADPLPEDMEGRAGKVVFMTTDGASRYTIYVRQGASDFDYNVDNGVSGIVVDVPTNGKYFDLTGREVTPSSRTRIYIKGGKKYLNK